MILYGYILCAYALCRVLPYYVVGVRWTAQRRWKTKIWNNMPFHDPNCIRHCMQELEIHDPMDQIRTGDLSPPNSNSTTKLRSLTLPCPYERNQVYTTKHTRAESWREKAMWASKCVSINGVEYHVPHHMSYRMSYRIWCRIWCSKCYQIQYEVIIWSMIPVVFCLASDGRQCWQLSLCLYGTCQVP